MKHVQPVGPADTRHTAVQALTVQLPVGHLYCVGVIHLVRQRPQLIDTRATVGPRRVGYMEDGVVLCASCVYELDLADMDDDMRAG